MPLSFPAPFAACKCRRSFGFGVMAIRDFLPGVVASFGFKGREDGLGLVAERAKVMLLASCNSDFTVRLTRGNGSEYGVMRQ